MDKMRIGIPSGQNQVEHIHSTAIPMLMNYLLGFTAGNVPKEEMLADVESRLFNEFVIRDAAMQLGLSMKPQGLPDVRSVDPQALARDVVAQACEAVERYKSDLRAFRNDFGKA